MPNIYFYEWRVHGTRGHYDVRVHFDGHRRVVLSGIKRKEEAERLAHALNVAYQYGRNTGAEEALERTLRAFGEETR